VTEELTRLADGGPVTIDTPLSEFGADSLLLVEVLLACEELYSKPIDIEKLVVGQDTTLRDLDRQILAS
jgi:acyl carrier protein